MSGFAQIEKEIHWTNHSTAVTPQFASIETPVHCVTFAGMTGLGMMIPSPDDWLLGLPLDMILEDKACRGRGSRSLLFHADG